MNYKNIGAEEKMIFILLGENRNTKQMKQDKLVSIVLLTNRILYLYFAHLKNKLKPMNSREPNYEGHSEHSAKHLLCAGVALVSWLGTLAHNGSGAYVCCPFQIQTTL